MGDYTNGQLIVYSCPPEEVQAFLRHIDEYGLLEDWGGAPVRGDTIKLGHTYCSNDVQIGMTYDSGLSVEAPNSSWVQWLDPKYEYNGDIEMHTPELGRFYGNSDTDGNVIVEQDRVLALINAEDATVDSIREGVRALYGTAWREAFEQLPATGTVKSAPRCAWCDELIAKPVDVWVHRDTGAELCAQQITMVATPDNEEE